MLNETELQEIECELCDGSGEIETRSGKYVGCPECVSRELNSTVRELRQRVRERDRALNDVRIRAQRIREDKAVVGVEASFIERVATKALSESLTYRKHGNRG